MDSSPPPARSPAHPCEGTPAGAAATPHAGGRQGPARLPVRARRVLLLSALVAAAAGAPLQAAGPAEAGPAPIPLAAFAQLPPIRSLAVAPDGQRIALGRPINGAWGLTVLDLASGVEQPVLVADPARFHVHDCQWSTNTRLVCALRTFATVSTGPADRVGQREPAWSLYAVNADGSEPLPLMSDAEARSAGILGHGLVSVAPDDAPDADAILVAALDTAVIGEIRRPPVLRQPNAISHTFSRDPARPELRTRPRREFDAKVLLYPDVLRVDTRTNVQTRIVRARDKVGSWIADALGNVRLGVGADRGRLRLVRASGTRWVRVDTAALGDDPRTVILHADAQAPRAAVLTRAGGDRLAVHDFDLASGTLGAVLAASPDRDVAAVPVDIGGTLQGLVVTDEAPRFVPLTPAWTAIAADLQAAIATIAPGRALLPVSAARDGSRLALRAFAPFQPDEWYLYDVPARRLTRVGSMWPALAGQALPQSRWVEYPARDGTPIRALLTTPAGIEPRGLPAVVLPHGGPVAHDTAEFDWLRAFIASRGYAVLQPNFRGSTGYGRKFLEAGFGEWGGAMQDDITDGLLWLRREGIADAARACIVGRSFGGYAALVAAWREPGLYRCAVSHAGVADLDLFIRQRGGYLGSDETLAYLNLPGDRAAVVADSPVEHAGDFAIPVLLVHADDDTNVQVEQSRAMAAALAAAGKPHRYVEQQDGDHFLDIQAHRTGFLTELERFLALHLDSGPAGEPRAATGPASP